MTPEGYVKKAVEDLLKFERIKYWRMNAGERVIVENGKRRRIRGHESGTPDFLVAYINPPNGWSRFLWIETKAPGKKPSEAQLDFARSAAKRGEFWLCIDDVSELVKWLKANREA